MYCSKCGTQIKEGEKFCENCGTPVETVAAEPVAAEPVAAEPVAVSSEPQVEAAPAQEPVVEAAPEVTAEAPADTEPAPAPKKTNKKKVTVISILAAAVAVIALCTVFLWDYVENFTVKTFSSPTSYYQYVETKNVKNFSASFGSALGRFSTANTSYGTTGEFKISFGDVLMDYIATEAGIAKEDISWISSIGVSSNTASNGNLLETNGNLLLNDKSILGGELIFDSENKKIYIRSEQLNEQFMLLDYSDLEYGNFDDIEVPEVGFDFYGILPDEETMTALIEKYLTIVVDSIENVKEESTTLVANGVAQDCTKLTVVINEETVRDMLKAVLRELKDDKEIGQIIKDMAKNVGGELISDEDINAEYDDFIDEINELLEELKNVEFSEGDKFEFTLITWVDGKGEAIGREFKVDFSDMVVRYASTHDGTDVGIEVFVGSAEREVVKLLGEGEVEGTKMKGDIELFIDGVKYINVNIKDYDVDLIEDNYVNGVFTVTVTDEMCDLLVDELDLPKKASDWLKSASLVISMTSDEKHASLGVTLNHGEDMIISVTASNKETKSFGIDIPEDAVSIKNEDDMINYLSAFDPNVLINALKDAGMPQEFVDAINGLMNGDYGDDSYIDDGYGFDDTYGDDYFDEPDFGFGDDAFENDNILDSESALGGISGIISDKNFSDNGIIAH